MNGLYVHTHNPAGSRQRGVPDAPFRHPTGTGTVRRCWLLAESVAVTRPAIDKSIMRGAGRAKNTRFVRDPTILAKPSRDCSLRIAPGPRPLPYSVRSICVNLIPPLKKGGISLGGGLGPSL
jgi:hypothetical protein